MKNMVMYLIHTLDIHQYDWDPDCEIIKDRPFEYNSLILGLMVSKNLLKKQQEEGVL